MAIKRTTKNGQPVSLRFTKDEMEMLDRVAKGYPILTRADMIRAAVRFWAVYAEQRLDANLHPLDANNQPLKWGH